MNKGKVKPIAYRYAVTTCYIVPIRGYAFQPILRADMINNSISTRMGCRHIFLSVTSRKHD